MIPARVALLTRAFYEWELAGRGWKRYPYTVRLEPPFRPFPGHAGAIAPADDGRRHTWLSALLERLGAPEAPKEAVEEQHDAPEAPPEVGAQVLDEHLIALPADAKSARAAILGWLGAFLSATGRSAFEISGSARRVEIRLALPPRDAPFLLGQLKAALPDLITGRPRETLRGRWSHGSGSRIAGAEFGLSSEFMVPLAFLRPNEEPLLALVAALAETGEGEQGLVQLLFEPCREPWAESALRSVVTPDGEPFFADAPEVTSLARDKLATPLFAASLRAAVLAQDDRRAEEILRRLAGGLAVFGSPLRNEFLPLECPDSAAFEADLLARTTRRSGMLLSAEELSALMQFPGAGVRVEGLWRGGGRTRMAPEEVLGDGSHLGLNDHAGETLTVRLPQEVRGKHMHVVGASGTGKSTLLVGMILEDIAAGHGVGVIDPHGDLVDEIAARIPSERAGACVLFDPSDEATAVGWNILGADSEAERELLASDLVGVFRRLSTSWGDQMTAVLANAILVFLESPKEGTLLDLRRFLVDAAFRREMLATVADPYLASFWEIEFARLVGRRPEVPILTRLDMFLRSRLIRNVVTRAEGRLDFRAFTDRGGVFLGKLASGTIGEENAALLGSLLVSKFHQVTLARAAQAAGSRRPFFFYIDEFHAVATASMASLFSGARKYRLGVTVAHQDLSQLHTSMPELERSILANAYTRVSFRLGEDDARQLSKGLSYFTAEDLASLGLGEAICRVGGRDGDFNLRTRPLKPVSAEEALSSREAIRRAMRERRGASKIAPQPETLPEPAAAPPEEENRPARASRPEPAASRAAPRIPERRSEPLQPRAGVPIDKATLDYLELVARSPFLSVRERNAALGLSAWRGDRLKGEILASELAVEVAINPGGRGERFKLLDLTDLGRELLAAYGIAPASGHGRGGIVHQWWARTVAKWLESEGADCVAVEDSSRGARVDVSGSARGRDFAVEIELREAHALENIRKDLKAGFDRVVCLLDSPESEERIRSKLESEQERVVFGELRDFRATLASVLSVSRGPNENREPRGRRRGPREKELSAKPATLPSPALFEPGAFSTPLAADYLGLSPATLETLRTRGGGPPFAKLGRRVVYAREDLDKWTAERKRASTKESRK